MNTQIQTVNFHGQILSVFQQNGKFYVAMKPICENIGLDWAAQLQKIKRNYVLNKGMVMMTTPSNGGNQEMICLPLGYLNGWLMNVEVNRVKPEIRENLIRYQMECYDVLFQHFMPQNSANPKTTKDDRTPLRQAVTMLVGKTDLSHSAAYKLVHQRFDVASIEDLTHEQIPQAIEYVHRLILNGEVLDKPQNHTVALPEFELVRIAQYLSKTYLSMQLFHELHRALCMVSPHFTKRTREEVENNLPLLRGIVHHLQDYSGSLKDPFFNQQFDKSMQFLGRITPRCLEFR